jgi:hypothetical protein
LAEAVSTSFKVLDVVLRKHARLRKVVETGLKD